MRNYDEKCDNAGACGDMRENADCVEPSRAEPSKAEEKKRRFGKKREGTAEIMREKSRKCDLAETCEKMG